MLDLPIVDPHHHLWDLGRLDYPWLQVNADPPRFHGDDSSIRHEFRPAEYRTAMAGVPITATVHIDAGCTDGLAEARWLHEIAESDGLPNAIVASAPMDRPGATDLVARLADLPLVRGIRHILNWHPDPSFTYTDRPHIMTEDAFLTAFTALDRRGLVFDLQIYPGQMVEAAQLAKRFPATTFVLNHTGMPLHGSDDDEREWQFGMERLAEQPNLTVKISGLGMTDHQWTVESIEPYVRTTLELFGTERCMFASNFPVDRLYSTATELYGAYDELTSHLDADARHAVFAGNARRVYRLGPLPR